MSKFISKQSVAIWYVLSALFATYIVGQVILWCFPDRSSLGTSLLFILMNCVPLIMAAVFSLIPIYQLPWITAGSSNYLIFYLMILGNTFLFGALKEYSKGAAPCILAHMLIDSLAVLMLVQSSLTQIILLVIFEILLASWLVAVRKS